MSEFFSKLRQKFLIIVIGLSIVLVPGLSYFSMAQDDSGSDEPKQLFLPMVSSGETSNNRIDDDTTSDTSGGVGNQPEQDLSPNDHGHFISHRFDRFTQYGETWPPQPKNIENVVWFTDDEPELSAASIQLAQTTQVAAASSAVQAALGGRYTHIGTVSNTSKDSAAGSSEVVTYFSHSSNATVEVRIENGVVLDVNEIPPTEYQPPLTDSEIDEAVEIARSYWRDGGYDRVDELEGFGILGLTPSGATGFNAVRVVYVSFHINADERPEYVGYVDLTNQAMLESWEE